LRILLVTARRLKKNDGPFTISGLTDSIASVSKVSGFSAIIKAIPVAGAALAGDG
jgi:anti-anti-sigma regulatory factor